MKKAMLAITLLIFGAIAAFSQVTIASYRGTQVEPQGGGDLCNGYLELALEPGLAPYNVSVSHRTNAGYSAQRQIHDPQFIDGFVSLYGTQVENYAQAGLTFDGTRVYGRFKNIYGDILTDDHVKALFKLADNVPASLLSDVRIQLDNNPALKARLLESDFFLKFRKLENSIPDLSDLEKSDLLKDLVDNPGEFLDYMEDLGGGKVGAWQKLINNAQIRKDLSILTAVTNLLDDVSVPVTVKDQIGDIVGGLASGGYKCRTYATPGNGYRFIDEIVDDLIHLTINYSDKPGFNKLLTNLKAGSTTSIGAGFVVDALRNKQSIFVDFGEFTEFEFKFVPSEDFAVDLVFGTGLDRKFVECKNWLSNNLGTESTVKQFSNTLKNIDDLDQMKYLFNTAEGRFKPTSQQVSDALFNQIEFLENVINDPIRGSNVKNLLGLPIEAETITKVQIENFINVNYNSIFL